MAGGIGVERCQVVVHETLGRNFFTDGARRQLKPRRFPQSKDELIEQRGVRLFPARRRKGVVMKKRLVGFVALVLMLTGAQAAFAMGGTHGKGDPKKPISVSTWPKGVTELANCEDRIGGHWINASDWFHYAGDAKAFNEFLQQYAKIKGNYILDALRFGLLLAENFTGYGVRSVSQNDTICGTKRVASCIM